MDNQRYPILTSNCEDFSATPEHANESRATALPSPTQHRGVGCGRGFPSYGPQSQTHSQAGQSHNDASRWSAGASAPLYPQSYHTSQFVTNPSTQWSTRHPYQQHTIHSQASMSAASFSQVYPSTNYNVTGVAYNTHHGPSLPAPMSPTLSGSIGSTPSLITSVVSCNSSGKEARRRANKNYIKNRIDARDSLKEIVRQALLVLPSGMIQEYHHLYLFHSKLEPSTAGPAEREVLNSAGETIVALQRLVGPFLSLLAEMENNQDIRYQDPERVMMACIDAFKERGRPFPQT